MLLAIKLLTALVRCWCSMMANGCHFTMKSNFWHCHTSLYEYVCARNMFHVSPLLTSPSLPVIPHWSLIYCHWNFHRWVNLIKYFLYQRIPSKGKINIFLEVLPPKAKFCWQQCQRCAGAPSTSCPPSSSAWHAWLRWWRCRLGLVGASVADYWWLQAGNYTALAQDLLSASSGQSAIGNSFKL